MCIRARVLRCLHMSCVMLRSLSGGEGAEVEAEVEEGV